MSTIFQLLFVPIFLVAANALGAKKVSVECKISPGSATFVAETEVVSGSAVLTKNSEIMVNEVSVDLKSLSTSMSLRDDHMKNKYLEVDRFPKATLILGKGKDGVGEGKIKIRDIEKVINGTYKILSDTELEAIFNLNLADFDIKGIRHLGIGVKDLVKVTVVVPYKKENP